MLKIDRHIGKTFTTPKGGIITILGIVPRTSSENTYVWASCSICSKDHEMWPEGSICARLTSFKNGRTSCGCSRAPFFTLEQHAIRIKRLLSGTNYKLVGVSDSGESKKRTARFSCPDHGEWECTIDTIMRMKVGCKKCYHSRITETNTKPKDEAIEDAQGIADKKGHRIISIIGRYTGITSKARFSCEKHGEFSAQLGRYIYGSLGCKGCMAEKPRKQIDMKEHEKLEQIKSECLARGIKFSGWNGEFAGARSKASLECTQHGEFISRFDHFVRGSGCPSCAKYGFQITQQAFVYAISSDCGAYLKVGITNNLERRTSQLARRTPFGLRLIDAVSMPGDAALSIEGECHRRFMSAGFKGFDGATEWLRNDPEIIEYIKQRA